MDGDKEGDKSNKRKCGSVKCFYFENLDVMNATRDGEGNLIDSRYFSQYVYDFERYFDI